MLLEQFQAFWQRETGVERYHLAELLRGADTPQAIVISGLRRAGKSTLLAQLAHRIGQDRFYYVNFEDERLIGFVAQDANALYQMLVEVFGERKIFLLDEIQNIPGWEHFVRRFMDAGFKFYITGSNASLLSRELGTRLTGRHFPVELFPFSFTEFLNFKGIARVEPRGAMTAQQAMLQRSLNEYLKEGGLPEALRYPELPLRRALYDDVLYRDIATRHHIDEVRALRELAFYLMSNPAGLVSFNKLRQQLQLGSVNTVKNYIEYLETSWLVFTANVYDFSVKRQQVAPKKAYGIDTGLMNTIGFAFSPNTGKLLENAVFLALRRNARNIFYYTTPAGYEVDFYLPETRRLIQVAQDMNQPQTRAREVRALLDAMAALKIDQGLILCEQAADPIREGDRTIEVRSAAEWLAEGGV